MRTTSLVRVFLAGCYLAIYAGVFAVAWHGRHGVGGGMAFTAPVVLGFPWTFLVVPALVQLGFRPNPNGAAAILPLIVVFVVPPALNALTILFVGRRRIKPPYRAAEGGETTSRRATHGPEV